MIKPEDVPPSVADAMTAALLMGETSQAAVAAALNAWPGAQKDIQNRYDDDTFNPGQWRLVKQQVLILPLKDRTHE